MVRQPKALLSGIFIVCMTACGSASGQSTLNEQQKTALQAVYGAQGETLRRLQQLQDSRTAVPLSVREFGKEPMLKLLQAMPAAAPDRALIVYEALHKLALDMTGLDHAVLIRDDPRRVNQYGEQFGPARSSWALAIVHLALFEAINTFTQSADSYVAPTDGVSLRNKILDEARIDPSDLVVKAGTLESAIFYAALGTLSELYPRKIEFVEARTSEIYNDIRGEGVPTGRVIGQATAQTVLKTRGWSKAIGFTDGSELPEPSAAQYTARDALKWKADPISRLPVALGGMWSHVRPFVIEKADAFRPKKPPMMGSPELIKAFKEVKKLGGDPTASHDPSDPVRWPTPTVRTGDTEGQVDYHMNETFKGIFWGYDGTALLCAPPRLYNMIGMTLARGNLALNDVRDVARLMAILNLAMGDAGIGAWEAKYYYLYPRPVTALREVNVDETAEGSRDERWTPLGAPVTNATATGRNLSPPFPAYPSGHAVFGGAIFEVLRKEMAARQVSKTDFVFVSDEYNGKNYSPGSNTPRNFVKVEFKNLDEPEEENGQSRIYLGIHWSFDKTEGIKQGREIGGYVFDNTLKRKSP